MEEENGQTSKLAKRELVGSYKSLLWILLSQIRQVNSNPHLLLKIDHHRSPTTTATRLWRTLSGLLLDIDISLFAISIKDFLVFISLIFRFLVVNEHRNNISKFLYQLSKIQASALLFFSFLSFLFVVICLLFACCLSVVCLFVYSVANLDNYHNYKTVRYNVFRIPFCTTT